MAHISSDYPRGSRRIEAATSSAHKLSQRSKSGPCLPLILNYKSSAIIWVAFFLHLPPLSPLPLLLCNLFSHFTICIGASCCSCNQCSSISGASLLGSARRQERAQPPLGPRGLACRSSLVSSGATVCAPLNFAFNWFVNTNVCGAVSCL